MQVFVARQPILDKDAKLFAYELLFRSGTDNFFPKGTNLDMASSHVIQTCLAAFDLDHLCPNSRAFINITRRVLVTELFRVLPPGRVVIELLETIEADEEVLDVCRRARKDGYILALDDFVLGPAFGPLLEIADFVKVDFLVTDSAGRKDLADRLLKRGIKLLAEKVETQADVDEAAALGYTYFQGYFFCRPEIMTAADIAPSKLAWLRILAELQRSPADFARLETIIRQDIALPVKLLRFINSAGFGLGANISSLRHALTLLGENNFRRWASLVALASLSEDRPSELFQTSLVRGRLCEEFGRASKLGAQIDLFLMGLLSVVDAVLERPMLEILNQLGLSSELKDALLALPITTPDSELLKPQPTQRRSVFALTLACERANWPAADVHAKALKLTNDEVGDLYHGALAWGNDTMKML